MYHRQRTRAAALLSPIFFLTLVSTSDLLAQDVEERGRVHGVSPPPGYYEMLARYPDAYRFQDVWKDVAMRVRAQRRALVRARDFRTLNAHFQGARGVRATAAAQGTAVAGTFKFPVLIGIFADSTHSHLPAPSEIDSLLFDATPAPPYSVRTFYDEMSAGLMDVQGDVIGWFTVDTTAAYYEGSNNGLSPSTDHTGEFLKALLDSAEANSTDFSQYDGDGDGVVDLVAVLHPLEGGECGTSHIWSHRWVYSAWTGSSYSTDDGVVANDYMIQPAVGGSSGCDSTQTMPIGTFSHELGHGMGNLPDLYDTNGGTDGIGVWGLMGSGNWNIQTSPAHMMAWSKDDVGWISITAIDSSMAGSYTLWPVVDSATAMRVDIDGTTQYFLLENRHKIGSDANLRGEGLAVYHIDPDIISSNRSSNTVNASFPQGVAMEQADGDGDLDDDTDSNAGDSGDIYPGSSSNTEFGPGTTPDSDLNDGSASAVQIDSITVNGDQSVAFRVNFNQVEELITTSVGTGTEVRVDGVPEPAPFATVWAFPTTHNIGVDSIQGDTLTRHIWQSWSDGGAREHDVTADATPDTFIATLATEHRLHATADSGGTITSSVSLDSNDKAWVPESNVVTLTAEADTANGFLFIGWSGDTATSNDTLELTMDMPYSVNADFGQPVSITTSSLADGVMGATAYADTLEAIGGTGTFVWTLVSGTLPTGLSLDTTGVVSGTIDEDGEFAFVVEARSSSITAEDSVTLTVTRPSLTLGDVVDELFDLGDALTADEERFLDLIGNSNGSFDIGDFRAHLQDTGVIADILEPNANRERPAQAGARENRAQTSGGHGERRRPGRKEG